MMKLSQNGIDLIKKFEGLRLNAYQDSVNVWTIGYGHTSMAGEPVVRAGLKITAQEAENILRRDAIKYERSVQTALTRVPNQNQFDAMVSLCYNIGGPAFARSSVCRFFNEGKFAKAANAFLSWNKAGGRVLNGLTRRRGDEMGLFMKPVQAQKPLPAPTSAENKQSLPDAPKRPWWKRLLGIA
jgi:lysozyme